jgi:hypothetical protein
LFRQIDNSDIPITIAAQVEGSGTCVNKPWLEAWPKLAADLP